MIKIKRVYEQTSRRDGYRVFIDRLWPRGKKKSEVHFSEWDKELSPSHELRKWFSHDPRRWSEFKSAYLKELKSEEAKTKIHELVALAKKKTITLVYGARDEVHNNAVILKSLLEKVMKKGTNKNVRAHKY